MPTKKEKVDALVAWVATPEELRPVPTLRQLALSVGATPDGSFYALANGPEVARQVLGITAAIALPQLPTILHTLAERALKGNVRAAEVLLNYIYRVISNLPAEQQRPDFKQLVDEANAGARKLLETAQSLQDGTPPEQERIGVEGEEDDEEK